jgi:hypothetical protein
MVGRAHKADKQLKTLGSGGQTCQEDESQLTKKAGKLFILFHNTFTNG